MKTQLTAALTMLALSAPAAAGQHWGDFKDNGCAATGLRSYSAVLWDIPHGASWEDACAEMPAQFINASYNHPAVCVNESGDPEFGAALAGGLTTACTVLGIAAESPDAILECWAAFLQTIDDANKERAKSTLAVVQQGVIVPWPYPSSEPLHGLLPDGAPWEQELSAIVGSREVKQVRVGGGGLNMWGIFLVPDETCTPPDYNRLPNAPWDGASMACEAQGMRLCTQDQLCEGGQPLAGIPSGDVWAAVRDGDRRNAWISVGSAYPDRLCRTHADVTGEEPYWGTAQGPQPVTGQETAFRCCP